MKKENGAKSGTANSGRSPTPYSLPTPHFSLLTSRGGFTLLEAVIYIGLFSILLSFTIGIFFQILAGYGAHLNRVETDSVARFLADKIAWSLATATAVNQPAVGATSTALSVTRYNFAGNPVVVDLVGGTARLSRAGGTAYPITGSRVRVSNLIFEHLSASGNTPEAVSYQLTAATSTASTTLAGTIYLMK
ncbi:MAG: hypothetical protein HY978_02145 [Candidatus Liptonbacteria bacterium]|nr:hypothetical protein [Candidatus Liptonbacteria bacterium]